jgi:hypothetical protein
MSTAEEQQHGVLEPLVDDHSSSTPQRRVTGVERVIVGTARRASDSASPGEVIRALPQRSDGLFEVDAWLWIDSENVH